MISVYNEFDMEASSIRKEEKKETVNMKRLYILLLLFIREAPPLFSLPFTLLTFLKKINHVIRPVIVV
jgi:hypothetical protein